MSESIKGYISTAVAGAVVGFTAQKLTDDDVVSEMIEFTINFAVDLTAALVRAVITGIVPRMQGEVTIRTSVQPQFNAWLAGQQAIVEQAGTPSPLPLLRPWGREESFASYAGYWTATVQDAVRRGTFPRSALYLTRDMIEQFINRRITAYEWNVITTDW